MSLARLAYSKWMTEWVKRLDPKASDELLLLARGRCVTSHKRHVIQDSRTEVGAGAHVHGAV